MTSPTTQKIFFRFDFEYQTRPKTADAQFFSSSKVFYKKLWAPKFCHFMKNRDF